MEIPVTKEWNHLHLTIMSSTLAILLLVEEEAPQIIRHFPFHHLSPSASLKWSPEAQEDGKECNHCWGCPTLFKLPHSDVSFSPTLSCLVLVTGTCSIYCKEFSAILSH